MTHQKTIHAIGQEQLNQEFKVIGVKYGDPCLNEDTEYYLSDGSVFYERRWGTCGYHYDGRDEDYWDVFEIVKTFKINEGTWKEVPFW